MTKHYQNIQKHVVEKFYDILSNSERDLIANDVDHETKLFNWFNKTVTQSTQFRYDDPDYPMNDWQSFLY